MNEEILRLKKRKQELENAVEFTKQKKKQVVAIAQKLASKLGLGIITREQYEEELKKALKNRTSEQWIKYYDDYLGYYNYQIELCDKLIKKEKFSRIKETARKKALPVLKISIFLVAIALIFTLIFILKPAGISVFEKISEKVSVSIESLTAPEERPEIIEVPQVFEEPEVPVILEDKKILIKEDSLTQYQAVAGQSVKWKKQFKINEITSFNVELPKDSENIAVKAIGDGKEKDITEIASISKKRSFFIFEKGVEVEIKEQEVTRITGNAVNEQNTNEQEFEITYETPAPEISELEAEGRAIKKVLIKGPDDVHYKNILSFTGLPMEFNGTELRKLKLYEIKNNQRTETRFIAYDTDENGLYDYAEWITPELSEVIFEFVIEISKAEHLDENKIFISDIYGEVYQLDNIWSEEIEEGHYIRVSFRQKLDRTRDITIYPRIVSGNPRIEVYEANGEEKIAEFADIKNSEYNKVYLTNLQNTQDVFDLKIINGSMEIEHIIDPAIIITPVGSYNDSTGDYSLDQAQSVFVSGDYAYTVSYQDDVLAVWDISSHGNPVPVGTINDSSLNGVYSVFVQGDYAYTVSYLSHTLAVWNISSHGNPVLLGTYTDSSGDYSLFNAASVFVSGDYVYTVSYTGDTLAVFNISAHGNPVPVGTITSDRGASLDQVRSVFVSGDYAYTVSALDDTLAVWDISSHGNPVSVGYYSDSAGDYSLDNAQSVFVQGDYAYTTSVDDSTLAVWNISAHGNPVPVGTVTYTDGNYSLESVQSVFVQGDYAYTTSLLDDTLAVWDISSHGNPVPVGSYNDSAGDYSLDGAYSVFVSGDYVYTTSILVAGDTLAVFQISSGGGADSIYPQFSNYWDNNASLTGSGTGLFNATVTNTNGSVLLEINDANYTASNLTANVYNASIYLGNAGVYSYKWHSWGNGTSRLYNKSADRSYTVNSSAILVNSCRDLNSANKIYALTNNVNSTGTCFNVTANNVTLDCNGYEINYSYGGIEGYGVYSNKNFTTIKNCAIKEGITTGNYKDAVYFNNSKNGAIINNTITTFNTYSNGIYAVSSQDLNISNNTITTSGAFGHGISLFSGMNSNIDSNKIENFGAISNGIFLSYVSNFSISNNTITTSGNNGISCSNSNSSIFLNNTIIASEGSGISISGSSNNTLKGNKANSSQSNSYVISGSLLSHYNNTIDLSNLAEGKPVNYTYNANNLVFNNLDFRQYGQVIFGWSKNITIKNSNFSDDSLNLFNVDESTINGNNINTSKGYGIYLFFDSRFNNLSNNTITTSGSSGYGIYLNSGSDHNLFSNNTITTSGSSGYGIYSDSDYGNYSSNTIKTLNTDGWGIYLYNNIANVLLNNKITTFGNYGRGIYIASISNNNKVYNNTITTSEFSGYGIFLSSSISNSDFSNNTITTSGSSGYGIYLSSNPNNISFSGMNIKTNNTNGYSLYISNFYGENNYFTIKNSVLNSSYAGVQEFYISNSVTGGEWNFTNVTRANGSPITINWAAGANGTLNVHWYLDVNVTDSTGALQDANVTAWDKNFLLRFSTNTTASGFIPRQTLLEYTNVNNTLETYFSDYTVNTTKTEYATNSQKVNMSTNKRLDVVLQAGAEADAIPPSIFFTSPTSDNGLTQDYNNIFVNVSASDVGRGNNNISTFIDFDNSLVGWWRMDDLNNTGGVIDYLGKNNGTAVGNAVQTDAGKLGKGFEFDGNGDYINYWDILDNELANKFTISVWIKLNKGALTKSHNYIFWKSDDKPGMWVIAGGNVVYAYNNSGGIAGFTSNVQLEEEKWYNIIYMLNGSNFTGYINTENIGSTLNNGYSPGGVLRIGDDDNTTRSFNGTIDDVMIFNRSLSAEEIRGLYANTSSKYLGANFTNLLNGNHTFKAYSQDTFGNVNFTEKREINVSLAPKIAWIQNLTNVTPSAGTMRIVNIKFTAYYGGGYANLNDSSAYVDFTKGGILRGGDCLRVLSESSGNYANYTCSAGMWYYDEGGNWNISISIADNNGNWDVNNSNSFLYEFLYSWNMTPSYVNWSSMAIGELDKSADNNITIKNLGNVNIVNATINATNLNGTTNTSQFIPAANFSFSNSSINSCSGSRLKENQNVSIKLFINYSGSVVDLPANNALGFCLKGLPADISAQEYRTETGKHWDINTVFGFFISIRYALLAVAVIIRKKKKAKKFTNENILKIFERKLKKYNLGIEELLSLDKKLEGRYGANIQELLEAAEGKINKEKELQIPIIIFKQGIRPAEALCKHLKENLGLKYSEIAKLINRDERTIWINYRNAVKKMKEKIRADRKMLVSVGILSNRKLSILESVVKYLKEKGFRNVEIAELLGKDQRNIYTLYSRARKKLK